MSDAEARFMWTSDAGLTPAYNVQLCSDATHGLIADVEVVNDPQDAQQLAPAADRLRETFGGYPREMLADGGYTNNESVVEAAERRVDLYGKFSGRTEKPSGRTVQRHEEYHHSRFEYDEAANEFIYPQGKRLAHKQSRRWSKARQQHVWKAAGKDCRGCEAQRLCCPGIDLTRHGRSLSVSVVHLAVEEFDQKMQRPEAQTIYKRRAPLAEFPNAWIKEKLKLRRFATRGLAKVKCEALWAALTFNLQRMFRLAPELVPSD